MAESFPSRPRWKLRNLGRDFVVRDRAATIRFRKPGRATLFATFRIDQSELDAVHSLTANGEAV
ncbi:MAG TPA: hypothetical protein VF911_15775 [Thermoanaerobaculia bacterium]|jgi:hypothetical protein